MKTIRFLTNHMKHAFALITAFALVATNSVFADEVPNLDDPKVRAEILKEAVLRDTLEERGPEGEELIYKAGEQTPYTGWVKEIHSNRIKELFPLRGGRWRATWFQNGQKWMKVHYKDGKREGAVTGWHQNGQKKLEANYKDGKPLGSWTQWHNNGQKKLEANYKDGKPEGPVTMWDKDGKVTKQARYKNGVEIR